MQYIRLIENRPVQYSIKELLADNPHMSFPDPIPDEILQSMGVFPVDYDPFPEMDPSTQKAYMHSEPTLKDGGWKITWQLIDKTDEELAQETEGLKHTVRATRDHLLSLSDWTQLEDAPVNKAAWAVYRQALREVPEQEGFPKNVVWPIKPE
jgi:hypothetical protein